MHRLGSLIFDFFDLLLGPLQRASPLLALGLVSVLASFLMLLVFRYTSDQRVIRETKNRIKAHILELWLFRDDIRTMFSAQRWILRLNLRYLGLMAKPALVLIIPMALMLVSLDNWFGHRPLRPGEAAIISVQVADGHHGLLENTSLEASDGLAVETLPLRIPSAGEVDWRIRASKPGAHNVRVNFSGRTVQKTAVVSDKLLPVPPRRTPAGLWNGLLNPGEEPIPPDIPVNGFEVQYPARSIEVFGLRVHWLVGFFVISIVAAFVLKGFFRVEI